MAFYNIWNHKGPNSGKFTPATAAQVAAAEAAGWGQDARKYFGHQFKKAEPPGPLPPPPTPSPSPSATPRSKDADKPKEGDKAKGDDAAAKGMQAGDTYGTRHIETAPKRRGRPPKAA